MELVTYLDQHKIPYTTGKDGSIKVGGSLDLEGTQITSLPEGLSVGGYLDLEGTQITSLPEGLSCTGLYFDPQKQFLSQSAYRTGCGRHSRTVYVVFLGGEFMVTAGCFFGPFHEFCRRVESEYTKSAGERYIARVQECVAELAEKMRVAAA
jgi:hypothetical protein